MNLLNDTDWLTHSKDESAEELTVQATYQPVPPACLHCGVIGNFQKFGVQQQKYRDAPSFGLRVVILAFRQRFRCRECKRTFLQPLPVDESRKMTRRCLDYIEKRLTSERFTKIAEDVGITEGTVRNIFADWSERMKEQFKIETPEWLGLDEVYLLKNPRCVVTNVQANTLVDILPDRNKATVQRYLMLMPDRHKVKVATMDMWTAYRDAVKSVIPGAVIVVDKFHVVKMANYCLDLVRKQIGSTLTPKEKKQLMRDRRLLFQRPNKLNEQRQLTLEVWLGNFPALESAYNTKEEFYRIYDAPDKAEAQKRYKAWLAGLSDANRDAFKAVITATTNWQTEIFNYFDHRVTNAYTEALNGLIKIANRNARGYSFDVIRAKMLYSGFHRPKEVPVMPQLPEPSASPPEPKIARWLHLSDIHMPILGVDLKGASIIITNPDIDHASSLEKLLANVELENLYIIPSTSEPDFPEEPEDPESTDFYE